MRPGRVVYIRVNPKDCMSAIDVCTKIGLNIKGMSFAQVVSVAFSSALEGLRQNAIIPSREGYEFSQMMLPYPAKPMKGERGRALDITKTFYLAGSEGQVPAAAANPARARSERRLEELRIKFNGDAINFSESEAEEMARLTQELYPDPDLEIPK